MEIRVLLESNEKVFSGEQLGVNEQSEHSAILAAVAKPVLEETGINIEEDNYVVQIRQATDNPEVRTAYVMSKPTAGK
jgi:hypothetical protein